MEFKEVYLRICEIKAYVIKLDTNSLKKYKDYFYSKNIPQWRLDLMWEYIWGDKTYEEITYIFKNNKLI